MLNSQDKNRIEEIVTEEIEEFILKMKKTDKNVKLARKFNTLK